MMGRNSEARLVLGGKSHPRIVHKLAFGHFDSDIGLHYFRKVSNSLKSNKSIDSICLSQNKKDSYYKTKTQMFVNSKDLSDKSEICYKKKILGDFYIHNPSAEFDFKIIISQKIYKNDNESKKIKSEYRKIFTGLKQMRTWLDCNTEHIFITNIVKLDQAVRNQRYEFEMFVHSGSIVVAVKNDLGPQLFQEFKQSFGDFLWRADAINRDVS